MSITIATINLNNDKGLERTLLSFENIRNNKEINFILQDGASTDKSLEIAANFYSTDEIISASDDGIYDAMNKSLARVKSDYVIWINSGDVILPEYWVSLAKELRISNADIFIAGIELAEETGELIRIITPDIYDISKGFAHQATFFRSKFIKELGGYRTKFKIAGDLELILRSARNGAIVKTSDSIASRFYLGGISSNKNYWFETWLAHYENQTISWITFAIHRVKFFLADHISLFRAFRHKKLSAIAPEKQISIFEIGAKERQ